MVSRLISRSNRSLIRSVVNVSESDSNPEFVFDASEARSQSHGINATRTSDEDLGPTERFHSPEEAKLEGAELGRRMAHGPQLNIDRGRRRLS